MDSPRFEHGAACYPVSVEWLPLTEGKSAERPGMRTEHHYVAVAEKDPRVQRFAQAGGIRDDRVQNRLKIARRFADDAQHLCGSGLLLKRLAQLARARLYIVEQADVLDGDYRLIGEGLQQRDLALRERSNLGTWNSDRTDRMAVTQHRHRQDASIRHHLGETQDTIVAIRQHIRDLNDGAAQDCASRSRVLAGRSRKHSLNGFQPFRRETMTGAKAEKVVIEPGHEGKLASTQPHGAFGDGIEHRLHVSRRSRDDAQNLRARCLQLARLGEFMGLAVELFLQIGGRGTATARGNRLLAAFELRRPTAADFHSCAVRRCTGLASGHDTAAPPSSTSRTILPASSTMQTLVSLTDTSSPAK